jgi:hypothetical protein
MPLAPKRRMDKLSNKEVLKRYQEWYKVKFNDSAPLTDEIMLRGFGHILYAKAIIAVYTTLKYNIDDMLRYCDFVFNSWSNVTGTGATVRYFPNWLASSAMMEQYRDSIKTAIIKKKSEIHSTYSDHSYVGKSRDKAFVPGVTMNGKKSIHRD